MAGVFLPQGRMMIRTRPRVKAFGVAANLKRSLARIPSTLAQPKESLIYSEVPPIQGGAAIFNDYKLLNMKKVKITFFAFQTLSVPGWNYSELS